LGNNECPKSVVFRGNKEYTSTQIQSFLGLSASNNIRQQAPGKGMAPANSR